MSLDKLLIDKLGTPLAKLMAKTWLGEPAATIAGGLFDIVSSRYSKHVERKKAESRFQDLGVEVGSRLLPLFEGEARRGDLNAEAVVFELQRTLEAQLSPALMVREELKPAEIIDALKAARPLPANQYSAAEEALYERALNECVRYLVNVASTLPKFDESFAAESLDRLGRIERDVTLTLDVVQRIEARVPDPTDEAARYEADYRQALIRRLDYLELFGADIAPESKRHSLSVAYVSLGLALEGIDAATNRSAEALLFELAAQEKRRLLIRGDAGMGKSTLLRWVAIQAAEGSLLTDRTVWAFPSELSPGSNWLSFMESTAQQLLVPFLLRLRDYQGGRLPQFDHWATAMVPEIGAPPAGWIKRILDDGRGLVLIDGVDEIAKEVRDKLRDEIASYVGQYRQSLFIVSSRPAAIASAWLAGSGFMEATINPLSGLGRDLFIDRWHAAVEEELSRKGRPQDLSILAAGVKQELSANPPIARLASNPLLCAMICALHRDRSQKLPESQSELCEALCHMLLHRRERESGLPAEMLPPQYRHLDYEQKRALLVDLAASMVRNNDPRIEEAKAESIFAEILPRLPGSSDADAPVIIRTLVERSGILREPRPGEVEFIHNTFKEYLAAGWFVAKRDDGLLVNNALEADWQPVLLFAAAVPRSPDFATALVRRLLDRAQSIEVRSSGVVSGFMRRLLDREQPANELAQVRSLQTLALQCSVAAKELDKKLQETVAALREKLFPPQTMAEAKAIAAAGDTAVEFLRGPHEDPVVRAACVRALRLIGTDRAQLMLQTYLGDMKAQVIEELAQAVNPLTMPTVLGRLQGGEQLPEGIARQVSDLTPLASLAGLQSLNLNNTQVSDLTPLASLAGLQSLDLYNTQVSDLTPLASLAGLQSLNLNNTQVSDLTPLASLAGLRELWLWLSLPKQSGLTPLAGLAGLQTLGLFVDAQGYDLMPLAGLAGLKTLVFHGIHVSDLTPLAGLTGLQYMDLTVTSVSDLRPLAGLTNLKHLSLSVPQVSDLTPLGGLTCLKYLRLSGQQVSDLIVLASLPNLTQLELVGDHRWIGLERLKRLPSLSITFGKM